MTHELKLTDKKLSQFIKSGGRKGAQTDFNRLLRKTAKINKNIDKK